MRVYVRYHDNSKLNTTRWRTGNRCSAAATALVASPSASGIQGGRTCSPVTGWSRACVPHRRLPSTVWRQPTPTPVEF